MKINVPPAVMTFFQTAYAHIQWGDERTLMEWDYADTSYGHRFFDQRPSEGEQAIGITFERDLERIKQSHIPPYQRDRQVELLTSAVSDREGRWQDIQPYYLEAFHVGLTFMSTAAFMFYLTAIIHRVYDRNLDADSMTVAYLLSRLVREAENPEFKAQLTPDMLKSLLIFLELLDVGSSYPQLEKIVTALGRDYPQIPLHDHFMNAIFAKEFDRAEEIALQMQALCVIDLGGTDRRYPDSSIDEYIAWGASEAVEILLRHGAALSHGDYQGMPLETLIETIKSHSDQAIHNFLELFIRYGIDWEQRGTNRWTGLILAAARGEMEMVKYLVEHGANIDAQADIDNFETALQLAIYCKQFAIALYLLDCAADPYVRNANGKNLMVNLGFEHVDELRTYIELGIATPQAGLQPSSMRST
jgi:hypothetical protein